MLSTYPSPVNCCSRNRRQIYTQIELPLEYSLFWYVTQLRLVVTFVSLKTKFPIFKRKAFQETPISSYQSTSRDVQAEQPSYLQRGRTWNRKLLLLLSYSGPGIYIATGKGIKLAFAKPRI